MLIMQSFEANRSLNFIFGENFFMLNSVKKNQ